MKVIHSALVALAALALPLSASAQDYPSKQITVVIPFTPGGSNDTIGRYLADGLGKLWNRATVVENRPGAGSAIGSAHVAQSAPDGHTMLFVSGTYTTNAATQSNLPFDPVNDLIPVAPGASGQFMLVAGSRVKAENLADFLEEAKSREMFYATTGVGSSTQFAAELFNERTGLKMTPVHYKGGTEALVDLIGGRVDVYFGTVTQVLPGVQGGQLKPIAVTSAKRTPAAPDVPTVSEGGVVGAETDQWWGVFVAAKTPPDIVEKLNAGINEVMSTPEAAAFLAKHGATPNPMNAAEFKALVHGELANWKKLAEERGITGK